MTNLYKKSRLVLDFHAELFLGWSSGYENANKSVRPNELSEMRPHQGQRLAIPLDSGWCMDLVWRSTPGPRRMKNKTPETHTSHGTLGLNSPPPKSAQSQSTVNGPGGEGHVRNKCLGYE